MLVSTMIRDPRHSGRGRAGRTVGLVFYTPKFWNCQKSKWANTDHQVCKGRWWHRYHMSYKGYMYWVGPKNRYEFLYMGYPGYGPKTRLFNKRPHDYYVTWF